MKIHVTRDNENLEELAKLYRISIESILSSNPNIINGMPFLKQGTKVKIRDDVLRIEDYHEVVDTSGAKFICPHCKNIILIP